MRMVFTESLCENGDVSPCFRGTSVGEKNNINITVWLIGGP